jgi:hypothetical protein
MEGKTLRAVKSVGGSSSVVTSDSLNGSETRDLATVGAFRVVSPDDLGEGRHGRDVWHGDWRHLGERRLLTPPARPWINADLVAALH